jgi:Protein of unknown function (DUF3551)
MRRTHVGLWEPRQGRTIQERVLTPKALRRICSRRKHDYRVNGGVRRWSTRHAFWMRSRPFPTSECGPAAATPSPRRIRRFCIPVIRNACSFFAPSRFSSADPDTHGDHAEVTSLNYFIIDVVASAPHLEVNNFTVGERERVMKTIHKLTIASAVVCSAFALLAMTAPAAQAGPIVPLGQYCLLYERGGTDCSFTSYAQCEATASGLAAECYGKTIRDDENSGSEWHGHPNHQN